MPLKSREYEERVKSMGFERATKWAMMEVIERHNMLERELRECGNQMLMMADLLSKVTDGAANMRAQFERFIRSNTVDEGQPTPSDDRVN